MERRTVRIYKAPNGQGEYINKTKKFLQKAQMGAETTSENVMAQKQMEALKQYVTGALSNDMEPEEVYKLLISKGIPKEIAYPILTQAMQEMEAPEEEEQPEEEQGKAEESKIGQTEYQSIEEQPAEEEEESNPAMDYYNSYANEEEPDVIANSEAEFQDGGIISYDQLSSNEDEDVSLEDRLATLSNFVANTADKADDFSDFGKDISEYTADYTPIEWDMLGDDAGYYKHGGSKKNFTKNVLALVRKQEGGDAEESKSIGQGNKKDTLTDDVSKIKSQFTDKLKEISTKAAVDALYEKMMNSKNPELIQSAQELAASRKKGSQMGSFEPVAQQGGYIGENQPDMFNYGGFDMPQAQKGFINKLGDAILGKENYIANNPYDVKTGALYKDPVSGLTPVARTVHKRGILGRPKEWTDYYSKGTGKQVPNTPGQEIKAAYEKAVAKDQKHGMSEELWDSLPAKAKRQIKRGERQLGREFERGVEQTRRQADFDKKSPEKYMYDSEKDLKRDLRNNGTDYSSPSPYEAVVIKTHDSKGKAYDLPRLVSVPELPEMPALEDLIMNQYAQTSNSELPDVNSIEFPEYQPIKYENLKEFIPTKQENQVLSEMYPTTLHQFIQGKSKDTIAQEEAEREAQEAEEADMFEQSMIRSKRGFSYGGVLGKYQIAGAVKSPTNKLSAASDPTATSGNLVGMLKPQENPNTLMGSSASFMNQNVPTNPDAGKVKTVEMDPNQTKGQTITSEDFGNPADDTLVAQDVQRKREFDGQNFVNKLNSGIDMFTGIMSDIDANKKQAEMYANNFTSDNLYGASTNKDRGDYVAYGQQTGMFRPDQTGQETMGRFAYGQSGGYMEQGGYTEGDEVDMTPEELEAFLANGGEVEYLES
jgi:hypothetical protein